jgi:disulfide bond formation protein DsbB
MTRSTRVLAAVALACVAAVTVAVVSQYGYDMQPCPWCVLQRLIALGVALACVVALVWRSARGRRVGSGVALLLALAGVAAALWQHFQAAASASCNLTLADKIVSRWLHLDSLLPAVFEARASCADAAVSMLGVPYDFWSLALFAASALALASLLAAADRR